MVIKKEKIIVIVIFIFIYYASQPNRPMLLFSSLVYNTGELHVSSSVQYLPIKYKIKTIN